MYTCIIGDQFNIKTDLILSTEVFSVLDKNSHTEKKIVLN